MLFICIYVCTSCGFLYAHMFLAFWKSSPWLFVETILCRIVLEILQWLEGTLSKVTKHGLLQAGGHLGLPPFNKQVMAMCSLEHIQPHLPSITCLSLLIQAILLNLRLVDMPPIGTSQLSHHLNRLLREVVMIITVNSHLHSNNKPGGPSAPTDISDYYYGQQPLSYNQQGQGYTQDGYGGYQAQPQSGYGQPPSYDQQQGYASAPTYGNVTNPTQDGHTPSYGSQGDSTQAPPVQPSSVGQQGYTSGQQPSLSPASYPTQGTTQPGYGIPPTSQAGYGNQPPAQPGYGPGYGAPQAQKPLANPPVYGQPTQSPGGTPGGYGQPAPVQPGYPHSQPPAASYAQPDSGSQRAPPSNYGAAAGQPGYAAPPYGAPPVSQPGYGQAPLPYNAYGAAYSQPPVYSADGSAGGNARGTYDAAPASQTAQQSGVAKTSPQS